MKLNAQKWKVLVKEELDSLHAEYFLLVSGIKDFPRNPSLIHTITDKEMQE